MVTGGSCFETVARFNRPLPAPRVFETNETRHVSKRSEIYTPDFHWLATSLARVLRSARDK